MIVNFFQTNTLPIEFLNQDNISIWGLVKNNPYYIKKEFLKFKRHF